MSEPADLATLQRQLQDGLLGTTTTAVPLTGPPGLTAQQALGLYQHSYQRRLLECMSSLHPAMTWVLGREGFEELAADYLRGHPPGSYQLATLDEGFADHLERTRPDAEATAEAREEWIDFLVDLARLERCYTVVLDTAGLEERASGAPAQAHSPRSGRLHPAPCLRLLRTRTRVHPYLTAVLHHCQAPEQPEFEPTLLAVTRRRYTVVIRELPRTDYALLETVTRAPGRSVTTVLDRSATAHRPDGAERLRELTDAGFLFDAV